MFFSLVFLLALQSPTVLQSMQDGLPVIGKLRFPEGMQTAMIEIVLESEDGLELDKTSSSPNGEFRFNGVKLGRYWLVIEGEKFENVRHRLEIDIRTFGMVNVTLALHPRAGTRPASGEEVISVESLRRKVPKDAMKEFEKGLEEQRKGQSKKALPHFQKSIKLAADFYEAHLHLGLQLQRDGDRPEAIRLLERAVELNPASVTGRASLGRLYFESEQYQKSVDTLTDMVKIGPASADTYFVLGSSNYKLNSLDAAEENLLRALSLAPSGMGQAHLQLYNVYMRGRQPFKALEQLDAYLQNFPDATDRQAIQQQAEKLRQGLKR